MELNLPIFIHKWKQEKGHKKIFDPVRRRYIILSPEEWVRQNFLRYLIEHKQIPLSLIKVEMTLSVNGMCKRSDIVVHTRQGVPLLAVECKAPSVAISQAVFDQLARYNLSLQVPYLVVTNGLVHFYCKYSTIDNLYHFLEDMPNYSELIDLDHRK